MIKKTLRSLSIVLLGGFTLTGCGNASVEEGDHSHDPDNYREHESADVYYCPMECEGDKTYTEAGSCPVCGMELVIKE